MTKGLFICYAWIVAAYWWLDTHASWVLQTEYGAIITGILAGCVGLFIRFLFDGWPVDE